MSNLRARARTVIGKELVLLERARVARSEQARISNEIAELDRLLSRKDEMLETLELLQVEAQGRKKADFEALLTSLIHDIIPGKQDKIVLTNGIRNNKASLDIDIEVNGEIENVYEDKGGSISNITAMGLRFVVLARNPNRRVLMFDEADCHLAREYIPAFAAVMNSLAHNMGIQVIYISHHPISCFEGYGRIIHLQKESGKIVSRVIGEEGPAPEGYQPPDSAIRYIRLRNFGPHQNTLVEFSPGLNIISGDIDLGKSKLIQAIADLTVNNGQVGRITHGKKAFEVELGLEEGMTLHWSYQRTAQKKTKYLLNDKDGVEIKSSDEGTVIPDWLHTYLAMAPVNGENIHLHSQKDSSYLLSSTKYSATERAQMLPLGRSSRDVMAMIQAFKTKLDNARSDRKKLEKELNKNQNLLMTMSLILENPIDAELQYAICDSLIAAQAENTHKQALLEKLERLTTLSALYETAVMALDRQVVAPVTLISNPEMNLLADRIERLELEEAVLNKITTIKPAGAAPSLHNIAEMAVLGKKISDLTKDLGIIEKINGLVPAPAPTLSATGEMESAIHSIEALENALAAVAAINTLPTAHMPALNNPDAMEELIKKIEQLQTRSENGDQILAAWKVDNEKLKAERQALIEEMGGICPTCDSPMKDHRHD